MQNSQLKSQNITYDMLLKPEDLLFTICDQPILSIGNITGITANIGSGKSHICEIFAAYWLNPKISTYNIKCINNTGKCLYIDTERTKNDCIKGINRIKNISQTETITFNTNLIYQSFISLDTISDKLQDIQIALSEIPDIKIIIIDGILDLISNPNDLKESSELGQYLVTLVSKNNKALLYTLHGNRNDSSGKGKGHVGDVFQRKSEAFLRIKNLKNGNKLLTSEFENGKIRNGYNNVSATFMWNTTTSNFQEIQTSTEHQQQSLFHIIFKDTALLRYTDLVTKYTTIDPNKRSNRTIKKYIAKAIEAGELKIDENGLYSLQK